MESDSKGNQQRYAWCSPNVTVAKEQPKVPTPIVSTALKALLFIAPLSLII